MPNHTLQRTVAGRRSCNLRVSWPLSQTHSRPPARDFHRAIQVLNEHGHGRRCLAAFNRLSEKQSHSMRQELRRRAKSNKTYE
jgi:hypothetical protein